VSVTAPAYSKGNAALQIAKIYQLGTMVAQFRCLPHNRQSLTPNHDATNHFSEHRYAPTC
jgi:hypothetical protein